MDKHSDKKSKNKFMLDIHTHTVASGHAYSTLLENIHYAQSIGLSLLGVSEHAPQMPHSTHDYYFLNSVVLPRNYDGLRLLFGAELNIMDSEGTLDLKDYLLERLDYTIASLHPPCIRPSSVENNTSALINAMKNPYVNVLGHPCDPRYPFDIPAVVKAARDNGVLLEVNNASYNPKNGRSGGEEITIKMLEECKKYDMPVILGSDAHFCTLIGNFDRALAVLEQADFPDELIINNNAEALLDLIGIDKGGGDE